jgi:hypothetical protein
VTTRAPIAAGQISIRKPAVILSGPKITWICESSSGGRVKSWSDLEPRRRQCWTQAFGHVGRPLRSVGRRETCGCQFGAHVDTARVSACNFVFSPHIGAETRPEPADSASAMLAPPPPYYFRPTSRRFRPE